DGGAGAGRRKGRVKSPHGALAGGVVGIGGGAKVADHALNFGVVGGIDVNEHQHVAGLAVLDLQGHAGGGGDAGVGVGHGDDFRSGGKAGVDQGVVGVGGRVGHLGGEFADVTVHLQLAAVVVVDVQGLDEEADRAEHDEAGDRGGDHDLDQGHAVPAGFILAAKKTGGGLHGQKVGTAERTVRTVPTKLRASSPLLVRHE